MYLAQSETAKRSLGLTVDLPGGGAPRAAIVTAGGWARGSTPLLLARFVEEAAAAA
jgi:hypothetical protein